MTLDELLARMREVTDSLEADAEVDLSVLEELAGEARALGPTIPKDRRSELLSSMDSLMQAARGHRTRLDETLKRLGAGRRALHSYGHLRGHTRGQRQNKKA